MNPLHSKINTVFLGIIAMALLVIAIDTLRPRYIGYSNPYNMKMNTKTGELFYYDPLAKKFRPLDAFETGDTSKTVITAGPSKAAIDSSATITGN